MSDPTAAPPSLAPPPDTELAMLRAVFDGSIDAVFAKDLAGRYLIVNDATLAALGVSDRHEVIGKDDLALLPPELALRIKATDAEILRKGRPVIYEAPLTIAGVTRFFETMKAPFFDAAGQLAGLVCIAREVTARKAAETALNASRQRFQILFAATSDVVWDWDVLTGEVTWNERLSEVFGYPLDERCRRLWQDEYSFRRGDGTYAHVLDRGTTVLDEGGKATRMIGAMMDITERHQLKERIALADQMASLGVLAAGVAHELNNPLAYVLANVQYAMEEAELRAPAALVELRNALAEAKHGAERVRDIVKNLKLISRKPDSTETDFDVVEALEAAIKMTVGELKPGVEVTRQYTDCPQVRGNSGQLTQAFLNILINAAQAVGAVPPVREREILVSTRHQGEEVIVEISDTGPGVPRHLFTRIFEPFFTTKPAGLGTGLGLSICHGIVTKMGGRIEVESEVNEGTTFRVLLPMGTLAPRAESPVASSQTS